ncbi:Xyloglucan galactosyltransferase XLT2, partial [Cucurbita argyrosperma subsp. sororia]
MDFKDTKAFSNSSTRYYPTWILILIVVLLQVYLIFTTTCSVPLSPATAREGGQLSNTAAGDPCSSGRVFVYDLPPIFNKQLLENCESLDPWTSRCDDVSNGGFGRRATELVGVVPDGLAPTWYWSEQYMLEPIIHNRILNHKCRTLEPESATAFYIPFYAGLSIGRFLWQNHTTSDRDRDSEKLIKWVQDQPYWNRSNGGDHFITLGRLTWDFKRWGNNEWGSSFALMPGMKNVARLIVEREPSDPLDIGVPFPTGFHPRSDADPVGGRAVKCTANRCASGDSAFLETFLDSDFCLQPKGDSYSRKSVFDCIVGRFDSGYFLGENRLRAIRVFFAGGGWGVTLFFIDQKENKEEEEEEAVRGDFSEEEAEGEFAAAAAALARSNF